MCFNLKPQWPHRSLLGLAKFALHKMTSCDFLKSVFGFELFTRTGRFIVPFHRAHHLKRARIKLISLTEFQYIIKGKS